MTDKVSLFGIEIDKLDMPAAIETITGWLDHEPPGCRFVVTPNVDHIVRLQSNGHLRMAYAAASLVLADGFPLVVAARMLGQPLPERVAGSELVPELFEHLKHRGQATRVFLLGAMPGVAVKAARRIHSRWPHINVVGTYSPPLGFETNDAVCQAVLKRLSEHKPEIVIFGVGAPKQELWAHRFHSQINARALLCVGATIDFLAGEKAQAPEWMRRCGLEWVHRCLTEPRRLVGRYAKGAVIFPQLLFREWWNHRSQQPE